MDDPKSGVKNIGCVLSFQNFAKVNYNILTLLVGFLTENYKTGQTWTKYIKEIFFSIKLLDKNSFLSFWYLNANEIFFHSYAAAKLSKYNHNIQKIQQW